MVNIQFQQQPAKEKKKSEYVNTAFGYFPASKPSPYSREGKAMGWPEVQAMVSGIMSEHGIVPNNTADLQKKLPALIFSLQQELDTLKAEKPPKKK